MRPASASLSTSNCSSLQARQYEERLAQRLTVPNCLVEERNKIIIGHQLLQMVIPEELDQQSAFLAAIQERTDPSKKRAQEPLTMRYCPPIKVVRGKLDLARAYLAEVPTPPPALMYIL